MSDRDNDPWREMAIEKQFRPLVDGSSQTPATLTYLEQGISDLRKEAMSDEDVSYALHVKGFQRMDRTYDYLLANLSYGRYAVALISVLWRESDMTWEELKEETLDDPDELLGEAERFGYTLIGM